MLLSGAAALQPHGLYAYNDALLQCSSSANVNYRNRSLYIII